MSISTRTVLFLIGASMSAFASAQQTIDVRQVPLSDVQCDVSNSVCNVDGTRTVSLIAPLTVTPTVLGNRIFGEWAVDFSGNLQVGGRPVLTIAGATPLLIPASAFFNPEDFSVNIDTSYTGIISTQVSSSSTPFFVNYYNSIRPTIFSSYNLNTVNVNSINVNSEGYFYTDNEDIYYNFSSVDPGAVVNNSVALSGRYTNSGDDNSGPIVFGRLTGSAHLDTTAGVSPSGIFPQLGYYSPFALELDISAQETTRLDENGLTTPTISVTEGINMNGSRVTNLAAGVEAGDAANKAQLDAEAGARAQADVALTNAIVTTNGNLAQERNTRAEADVALSNAVVATNGNLVQERNARIEATTALGNALTSETSARMAADAQLAAGLDALGSRVEGIEFRLEQVNRRMASGTAIAVAMGGGVFLPNKRVNITANVATYDGAHAGAMQVGVILSPNMAVNGGVAKGLNRSGKTAARAGMTFGW